VHVPSDSYMMKSYSVLWDTCRFWYHSPNFL